MPKGKVSEPLWSRGEAPTIPIACVAGRSFDYLHSE